MDFDVNFRLVLISDLKEIRVLDNFLLNIFSGYKINRKYFNRIYLCISEAVQNSIVHGNKCNKQKKVILEISVLDNHFYVKVTDEGTGFRYDGINNPTLSRCIRNEYGRGIHIIKNYANEISFNEIGNCVMFRIDIDGKD